MENPGTEDIDFVGLRSVNAELYQRFRARCAEKKLHYGTGFERAINAWLIASAGDDLLSQPPFDTINPSVINEFRSRCAQKELDAVSGIAEAMVVWIHNLSFTDPYPPRDDKAGKKAAKCAASQR